ncbi:MAG: YdhR family protein [Rhodospirillales bacterium]|nr:YdhR family protein [Rhodospirillales bacterium]
MIITVVNFSLPEGMSNEEAAKLFEASVPRYQDLPGLRRKHYLLGQDNKTGVGGGVYLWDSREAAEAVYNEEWRKGIEARFGATPTVDYYDTPVTVEN